MDLEEALAQAEIFENEEIFVIDNDLRTITIPSNISNVGVESDEDVRRLNFQMPKQYGQVDLSEFDIRINYLNANGSGDIYAVTDKEVSGDYIAFSWLLGRNAMAYKGSIRFIVCLKKTDEEGIVQQEFNTTIAQLTVLEGLETTQKVVQENPDIIEAVLKRLDDLEENGGGSSTPGKDGVGISNIAKTGTQGLVDTYTITLTNNNTYTFTVANGKDGTPGAKGDPGQAATIQIGTVTTGEPGTPAQVTNSGTENAAVLDFVIPKGAQGEPGENSSGGGLTVSYDEETETIVFSDSSTTQEAETVATAQNLVRTFAMPTGETAVIPEFEGMEKMRLIADITLSEDAHNVAITQDLDGNPFELKQVLIQVHPYGSTSNSSGASGLYGLKTQKGIEILNKWGSCTSIVATGTGESWTVDKAHLKMTNINALEIKQFASTGSRNIDDVSVGSNSLLKSGFFIWDSDFDSDAISELYLQAGWGSGVFGAGTVIQVYGT